MRGIGKHPPEKDDVGGHQKADSLMTDYGRSKYKDFDEALGEMRLERFTFRERV